MEVCNESHCQCHNNAVAGGALAEERSLLSWQLSSDPLNMTLFLLLLRHPESLVLNLDGFEGSWAIASSDN